MTIRVLFVCMGNICRSPAAEGIFKSIVESRGLSDRIKVDSAGTIGYHAGEPADRRMQQAASRRGYDLTSIGRQVRHGDFEDFDYVVAMDRENLFNLHSMDPEDRYREKIKLIVDYHPDPSIRDVPDPYYGGQKGFERVLDILEVSLENFLAEIQEELEEPA